MQDLQSICTVWYYYFYLSTSPITERDVVISRISSSNSISICKQSTHLSLCFSLNICYTHDVISFSDGEAGAHEHTHTHRHTLCLNSVSCSKSDLRAD